MRMKSCKVCRIHNEIAMLLYFSPISSLIEADFITALFAHPLFCFMATTTTLHSDFNLKPAKVVEKTNHYDPHALPSFDDELSATPKLYLPPLLSSLPERYILFPQVDLDSPPIVTETRLPDIDPASLSLHKALHHFRPVTPDYASVPYSDAFSWSDLVLPLDEEREWYCVVFRSKRMLGRDDICG